MEANSPVAEGEREFPTSDVIKITGASRATLFNWEKLGRLNPRRDRRGWRWYSEGDLGIVKEIMDESKSRTSEEYRKAVNPRKEEPDPEPEIPPVPAL